MAGKKNKTKKNGEQLALIDVQPENAEPIIQAARLYKKFQAARLTALNKEVAQKRKILELVKVADLQPLEGGKIKFEYDNVMVSITPRDELVTVKDKTESE